MVVQFIATDMMMMDHNITTEQEWYQLRQTVANVLELSLDSPQVTDMAYKVHRHIDTNGDGHIGRMEAMNALGQVCDEQQYLA